jgi:hypothetical protein
MKKSVERNKKVAGEEDQIKTNEKKSRGRLHSFFKGYWYSMKPLMKWTPDSNERCC